VDKEKKYADLFLVELIQNCQQTTVDRPQQIVVCFRPYLEYAQTYLLKAKKTGVEVQYK
jgi:hypothetical protein